jgi:hypothetical protein
VFITAHDKPRPAPPGRIILQKPFDPHSLLEAIERALGPDGKYVEGDPS